MKLIPATDELFHIDLDIMNSDPFFNRISANKERLSPEEVRTEIDEAKQAGAERFLVQDGQAYVGVVEYLPLNPSDQCTWLGLLLIKKEFQSLGYGTKTLHLFYQFLKEKQIRTFRIGVIAENEPAHRFWKKQGFVEVKKAFYKTNIPIMIYEKVMD
ncbi:MULTISPECIES: GNAT family N-acetyltransferase [unclassified Paenibacillus]|uniref:GNAT family N-acetyltransferase n=1 Tax=unclassified Paenibacillus TaxID=185978 RepID=UPI001C115AFD|nr:MULTISPECIES: GNAT family N-acetyltransferase [unclassified Paenibacillus]MBU5445308.1 GNAT family N-acetyltransferase [Paenibacillus sp. MSJ-34]CAH0118532.1 hypothetical protein PAE9249_01021 [Paenibacillus sp. CECT 9249]